MNPRHTPLRNSTAHPLQNQHRRVQPRKLNVRAPAEAARVHRHQAAAHVRQPAAAQLAARNLAEALLPRPQVTPINPLPDTAAQAAKSRQSVATAQAQQLQAAPNQQWVAIAQAQQLQAVARSRQ